MAQTFLFEELDPNTREYLTRVRDSQGEGAPGVFAPATSAMAGCGCASGVVVIAATLVLTLTDLAGLILRDPTRLAMLQTAGLLVGGWLVVAGLRSAGAKGSKSYAGHWVYVDAQHLYEAYREQVVVTPVTGVVEANFTHNYTNGAYQGSVVRVVLEGGRMSFSLKGAANEAKAEQIVVFLNYLAWARSAEGGQRARLHPAQLGGLARYVAEHDVEPKHHDETLNYDLTHTEIDAVPEEPAREGRAIPAVLPYILLVLAGGGMFFLMKQFVNPPLRDDATFKQVMTEPVEPVYLRVYLLDERNVRHREEVLNRLKGFYSDAVTKIKERAGHQPVLNDGMVKLLESLAGPEQPAVSLKVEEVAPPDGQAAAEKRVNALRDGLVGGIEKQPLPPVPGVLREGNPQVYVGKNGIIGALSNAMPPVKPADPNAWFPEPRFPVGAQLIDFAKIPEGADHAHIEVTYKFNRQDNGNYRLWLKVEFRTQLDAGPVRTYEKEPPEEFPEAFFDTVIDGLDDALASGMVGRWEPHTKPAGIGGLPGFPVPK